MQSVLSSITLLATGISAVIFLFGWIRGWDIAIKIFYPVTTALILVTYLLKVDFSDRFAILMVLGFLFAVLADIMHAISRKQLSQASLSFSVVAFSLYCMQDPGPYFMWMTALPVALVSVYFIRRIYSKAERYRLMLILYTLLLGNLLIQAAGRAWYIAEDGTGTLFAGSLLLTVSESFKISTISSQKKSLLFTARVVFYYSSLLMLAFSN